MRSHLDGLQKRIEQSRANVSAAQTEVNDWVDERETATRNKISEWRANRETSKLQNRADKAERYAAATIDVALAAFDKVEQASLEA